MDSPPPDTSLGNMKSASSTCSPQNELASKPVPSSSVSKLLGYASLVTLMLQNALQTLVMRYVRVRDGDMFMSTTAVCMSEMIKCLVCLLIIFVEEKGSVFGWLNHLNDHIFKQPLDCLKISIPAIVYMVQNNLLYVAASNLEASTFQVTYQLKLLTTALFSVAILRKQLSRFQWFSLVLLFIGVGFVHIQPAQNTRAVGVNASQQNQFIGFSAVVTACILSGFAGVYFEKLLKNTPQSIYLRNVQMGFLGFIFGLITVEIKDGDKVKERGFFFGYDFVVWCVIFLLALGGLIVAVVIKYTDNILKGFATSGSIILACMASVYFFDFKLSTEFCTGTVLVLLSVYIYSKFIPEAKVVTIVQPKSLQNPV